MDHNKLIEVTRIYVVNNHSDMLGIYIIMYVVISYKVMRLWKAVMAS
jgi:hypothetical protein